MLLTEKTEPILLSIYRLESDEAFVRAFYSTLHQHQRKLVGGLGCKCVGGLWACDAEDGEREWREIEIW